MELQATNSNQRVRVDHSLTIKGVRVWFAGLEDSIDFELFDNPFVKKWSHVLKAALDRRAEIINGGTFYGPSIFTKQELVDVMKKCVDKVNSKGTERITLIPHIDLNQEFLNALHKEFERISLLPAYRPGRGLDDVHQALIDLNAAIHQCEVYTNIKPHKPSNHFSMDINLDVMDRYDFAAEDFQYFTPDRFWGELFLNYATVGVPVLNAYWNRERLLPVPQTQYTADFRIGFGMNVKFQEWDQLRSWVADNYNWNPYDPRLAVGYISLGRVRSMKWNEQELFNRIQPYKRMLKIDLLYR